MCRYVDKHDKLRVTDNDLTADALNKRIRTIYKVGRDITVHKIGRDIYTKGEVPPVSSSGVRISFQFRLASFSIFTCFQLDSLQREDLIELIRHPVAEESDEEEEQEESEEHYEPKLPKRRAETAAEGSAKKTRPAPAGSQRRPDSKPHERARVSQIEAAGQGATITLPKSRFVLSSMTSLPFPTRDLFTL